MKKAELNKHNLKFQSGKDVRIGERVGNVSDNDKYADNMEIVMYDNFKVETFKRTDVTLEAIKPADVETYIRRMSPTPIRYV